MSTEIQEDEGNQRVIGEDMHDARRQSRRSGSLAVLYVQHC
jgi:hypothetical protein